MAVSRISPESFVAVFSSCDVRREVPSPKRAESSPVAPSSFEVRRFDVSSSTAPNSPVALSRRWVSWMVTVPTRSATFAAVLPICSEMRVVVDSICVLSCVDVASRRL